MGQNLFAPPNVKGWPGGDAWINSSTLLARKQFLDRVVRNEGAPAPRWQTAAATPRRAGRAGEARGSARPRQPAPATTTKRARGVSPSAWTPDCATCSSTPRAGSRSARAPRPRRRWRPRALLLPVPPADGDRRAGRRRRRVRARGAARSRVPAQVTRGGDRRCDQYDFPGLSSMDAAHSSVRPRRCLRASPRSRRRLRHGQPRRRRRAGRRPLSPAARAGRVEGRQRRPQYAGSLRRPGVLRAAAEDRDPPRPGGAAVRSRRPASRAGAARAVLVGGRLAVLQGVGYPDPNLSHFRSIEIWDTGSRSEEYLPDGWLTRAFAARPVPPRSRPTA